MKNTKKIISKILIYFALILGVLFCLVPLYWMIRSSLMNTVEVFPEFIYCNRRMCSGNNAYQFHLCIWIGKN